jgi:hypothetical protein
VFLAQYEHLPIYKAAKKVATASRRCFPKARIQGKKTGEVKNLW